MPHVKLDDRVTHHEKIMSAGTDAFALWVGMLAHANRSATNGHVPKAFLASYFPTLQGKALHAAVRSLVRVGLLVEAENSWLLHDYESHQGHAMRDVQRETKRQAAARQKNYMDRERSKKQLRLGLSDAVIDGVSDASRDGVTRGVSDASPTPSMTTPYTNSNSNSYRERERDARAEDPEPEVRTVPSPSPSPLDLLGVSPEEHAALLEGPHAPEPGKYDHAHPAVLGGFVSLPPSEPVRPDELDGPDGAPPRGVEGAHEVAAVHKLITDGFRARWEPRMALLWSGPLGKPATEQAYWVLRQSNALGVPAATIVEKALDHWFGSDWPKTKRFPWNALVKQLASAYVEAVTVEAGAKSAAEREYVTDFGALSATK